MPANFVHLRLHTAYSLAESTLRIKNLARLVAEDNQPAAAITDTNNMFGALEFSKAMINLDVQPIMGAQLNVNDSQGAGEVVLLAQNETGYVNLSHLLSDALLNSEANSDPHCSFDVLAKRSEGLILLSGGVMDGFVGLPASDGRQALAKARLQALNDIMQGRVYIELQRHGMGAEQVAEPVLVGLADELDLPLVATNDCRFDSPKMAGPHDALVCIGTGRKVSEDNRIKYSSNHHFKSSEQMVNLFVDIP